MAVNEDERPRRKAVPDKLKLFLVLRQGARCADCGHKLVPGEIQYDHRPALINRDVNEEGTDYVPAQLDPEYLQALHNDCHDVRTFGPGGEKRITTAGSDIGVRDKVTRLQEQQERIAETRRRILAPSDPEAGRPSPKPKYNWGKRPLRSRPFPKGQKT